MKVAVVGATGLVGNVMIKALQERAFPYKELLLVASERSVGKQVVAHGKQHTVIGLAEAVERAPDIALFSAGGSVSREWAPRFAEKVADTHCEHRRGSEWHNAPVQKSA